MAKTAVAAPSAPDDERPMHPEEIIALKGIEDWQDNFYNAAMDFIGMERISSQQKEFLDALSAMIHAKRKLQSSKTHPEIILTEEESVWAGKFGISVRSGKGCGKDAVIAISMLIYLSLFENARIPCIGPTGDHLRTVLWAEVSKWHKMKDDKGQYRFKAPFREMIEVTSKNIRYVGVDKPGDDWGAFRRMVPKNATDEERKGILSGLHGENMLLIFDEAASIEDDVFLPLEDTMTDYNNIAILIWNPTRVFTSTP